MQGAEGADLERKQILEDQFRAASETLFRKRRDMGQLEGNFKTASLELIDIRNQKQEIDREHNDGATKKTLLDTIASLGKGDPLAAEYQRKLYSLLY